VFRAHAGPVTSAQRLWIASLAVGNGRPALLGGRAALASLGLKGFPPDRIDVLLPAGRREDNPPTDVVVHRTTALAPEDVCRVARPPCTGAARSVVDAASWAISDREATTVIAMAFQQRFVALDDIRSVLGRLPKAKRRKLTWATATDASGGAESLGEIDLARLLRRAGLPEPTRQVLRTDAGGRRRYLDVLFRDFGLHVEVDGAHHLDAEQAWLDMDRQNQLWLAGERVLRFPAWLIRRQPRKVVADVRRALRAAGWRG
jgi:hypothetical protein